MGKYKIIVGATLAIGWMSFLSSCASIPKKAKPVENFDVNRYLGTWFEIARFDFRFEKDLDNTMAQYSLNDKGNVKVLNSGHNFKTDKWTSANGVAKFRGDSDKAALKVSFFGPFYSGYNIIEIDPDYQYVLVAGDDLKNLWILSRKPTIPEDVKNRYLQIAQEIGYDTSDLVYGSHDRVNE